MCEIQEYRYYTMCPSQLCVLSILWVHVYTKSPEIQITEIEKHKKNILPYKLKGFLVFTKIQLSETQKYKL